MCKKVEMNLSEPWSSKFTKISIFGLTKPIPPSTQSFPNQFLSKGLTKITIFKTHIHFWTLIVYKTNIFLIKYFMSKIQSLFMSSALSHTSDNIDTNCIFLYTADRFSTRIMILKLKSRLCSLKIEKRWTVRILLLKVIRYQHKYTDTFHTIRSNKDYIF